MEFCHKSLFGNFHIFVVSEYGKCIASVGSIRLCVCFVLVCCFLEYPENAENPPKKTANLVQKHRSSGNLPISVYKLHNSLKDIKLQGKLPISVYKNCIHISFRHKIVKKVF